MKKRTTTLFPRSTIVFVIPSSSVVEKRYYLLLFCIYSYILVVVFCFVFWIFFSSFVSSLNKKRLFETLFWAFFWGPFFTPLISLLLLVVVVVVVRVSSFGAREREKKPAIDRGSTTPFGVLSLPPFSRSVRPRLSRSPPQSFLRFPLVVFVLGIIRLERKRPKR